jgi:hypothetical protein
MGFGSTARRFQALAADVFFSTCIYERRNLLYDISLFKVKKRRKISEVKPGERRFMDPEGRRSAGSSSSE